MDVSIVITTRNRKSDLLRLIESIRDSDIDGIKAELIVVDDCSNDGTEIINSDSFGICGDIVHNRSQQMMVRSRNIGAKASKGRYIFFIDDDNVVDRDMLKNAYEFARSNPEYGIVGPSMHYLGSREKYMDFQRISLCTGRTRGMIDNSNDSEICDSDGIPNAFMIRRQVFDDCGFFDENLIQTFTEPDFAFHAGGKGYKCGILKRAKIYHDIKKSDNFNSRALGGQFVQKAYCLMRNRTVIVFRYGNFFQKIVYLLFFSWFWPAAYSLLVAREKRLDLVSLYWKGFFDGIRYALTGKLVKSI